MQHTQTLLQSTDQRRRDVVKHLNAKERAKLGQYMTPAAVAHYMATLFSDPQIEEIQLLDPGAGIGVLTAAFVDRICGHPKTVRRINIIANEFEPILTEGLITTLEECRKKCTGVGIEFAAQVLTDDFILRGGEVLGGELFSDHGLHANFTHVIMNPPYKKIRSDSHHRLSLRRAGIETSNLYTAFLAIAIKLLAYKGELVAIIPRSFCNGVYFKPFRSILIKSVGLRHVHIFHSRKKAFSEDKVLQENIIIHTSKGITPENVTISASHGPDFSDMTTHIARYNQVVIPTDPERFIHFPTMDGDQEVVNRMSQFTSTLRDLGIEVSTGPVVDFRLREFLRAKPEQDMVPLIYPGHFTDCFVEWPKPGFRKPNALVEDKAVQKWLLPKGWYTLTKRFTTKEEKRRLVAAIFDPNRIPYSKVGFENHLNVFHSERHGLPYQVAKGFAVFLNSTLVDQYFRIFSGHTQVNATDLRNMRYPSLTQLESLGRRIPDQFPVQERIDQLVEEVLPATGDDVNDSLK